MRHISYSELITLGTDVFQNVQALMDKGISRVELMMDGGAWDRWNGQYGPLTAQLKKLPIAYSIHPAAWDINLTAETEILRDAAYRHHLSVLHFAAELGASQVVLHPGFAMSPCFSKAQARQRAHDTTGRLAVEAKALGVLLAFENVGYNGQSIYTQEEYEHALDQVDSQVAYLIDVGHANINGWDIPSLIHNLSSRLAGVHIHDNNGKSDQHLPIGQGTIHWEPVFKEMASIANPDCEFILEYAPGLPLDHLEAGKAILASHLAK